MTINLSVFAKLIENTSGSLDIDCLLAKSPKDFYTELPLTRQIPKDSVVMDAHNAFIL